MNNNTTNTGDFNLLIDAAKKSYSLPNDAFDNYRIKRGLREKDGTGVMAGVTRIGNAHGYVVSEGEKMPIEGKLEYRGVDMSKMIDGFVAEDRYGFEECIYLLLFGNLPTKDELENFKALLADRRHLPPRFTEDVLMSVPSTSIMNKMAIGVLSLYSYDENPDDTSLENMLRQCVEITAKLPVIAAHSYAVYRSAYHGKSLNLHKAHDDIGTAQNFLRILRSSKQYTEEEARLLDLCMVIQAEHGGGNNSTFTCRVLSSSGTDTYSAIAGAIGSLKGPLHGGANIKVAHMFDDLRANIPDWSDESITDYLVKVLNKEAFDRSGLIYGMGHAIYSVSDPRAEVLKTYAKRLSIEKGMEDLYDLYKRVAKIASQLIAEKRKIYKGVSPNVDFYSGMIYRMLNLPEELFTPIFAVARIAGWSAHRIEELQNVGKIIRPAYRCVKDRQDYIPIDERG